MSDANDLHERNAYEAGWRRTSDRMNAERLERALCLNLTDLRREVQAVIDSLNEPVEFSQLQQKAGGQ